MSRSTKSSSQSQGWRRVTLKRQRPRNRLPFFHANAFFFSTRRRRQAQIRSQPAKPILSIKKILDGCKELVLHNQAELWLWSNKTTAKQILSIKKILVGWKELVQHNQAELWLWSNKTTAKPILSIKKILVGWKELVLHNQAGLWLCSCGVVVIIQEHNQANPFNLKKFWMVVILRLFHPTQSFQQTVLINFILQSHS